MPSAVRVIGLAIGTVIVGLIVSLTIAGIVLGVPKSDLGPLAELLATVGGTLAVVTITFVRTPILTKMGSVRAQMVVAGLVGSFLLLAMLMASARAMFISSHDLSVLLTMLTFAAVLAVGFSLSWAEPMARRIEQVRSGTAELARGHLDVAVPQRGRDEIAQLAGDFNSMADALRLAASREREIERSRRDLIAAISHDLRTPLAAVRALIEALTDDVVVDPTTRLHYLRSARREILHLSQLVDDLFELSQIDAGALRMNREPASIHDLVSDTLASFQPRARALMIRLEGDTARDVDPVLVDAAKVQRVLHNLVDNALRHTPPGGSIRLHAYREGEHACVEVVDDGEGIRPDDLPYVFVPSYRGERSRTRASANPSVGAGLGLAIARGLIEAHGGTISVESCSGRGTCFTFTLPRA